MISLTINSDSLSSGLLTDVLQSLSRCFDEQIKDPFFVIGATARDLLGILMDSREPQRRTRDLDICIAVPDWNTFDTAIQHLRRNGFRKDPNIIQRLYFGTERSAEYEIDVVPFGGVSPDNEHIWWPPDANPMMTVRGFDAVLKQCVTVHVQDRGFKFNIPTAGGLFLLKFDAWLDRHDKTDKDALDMAYLMQNYYLANATDTRYIDVYDLEGDFSELRAGAYMLAMDIRSLVKPSSLKFYRETINTEILKGEASGLLQKTMPNNENAVVAFDECVKAWQTMADILGMND